MEYTLQHTVTNPYDISLIIIAAELAYKQGFTFRGEYCPPDDKQLPLAALNLADYETLFECVASFKRTQLILKSKTSILYLLISEEKHLLQTSLFVENKNAFLAWEKECLSALIDGTPSDKNKTPINFWYHTSMGPTNYNSIIETPCWDDLKSNYPTKMQNQLEQIVNFNNQAFFNGKILLFHGVPGTGKTWYIRSLMEMWKKWCYYNYVIDVDKLFSADGAGYLLQVLGIGKELDKHRLLILEDCGELVSKDAKMIMGQALSRILNITDGLVGVGLKLIVLLTTNERLDQLNDAISRPGRCLANVEFEKFSSIESTLWLRSKGIDLNITESQTIAKLYEHLNTTKLIQSKESKKIGF